MDKVRMSQVNKPQNEYLFKTFSRSFQEWFEAQFAVAPAFFLGRGIFQYNWGFLPFRVPITVVIGKPILVEKIEDPTREQIAEVHAK